LGAVDYVVKPFEFITLKSRIWRCLESARLTSRLAAEAMTAPSSPATVLIVDDNELNRDLLAARIEHFGCRPTCAEGGDVALARLREGDIDVVLLDIMMPGIDGYEVLTQIRSRNDTRHLPVVMISALTDPEASARCFELGADDFVTKPFNAVELKIRLSTCLNLKRLQERDAARRARLQDLARKGAELGRS
jgi:DNA-binding response OmpR family regulator